MFKRMPADEEAKVLEQLQQLAKQDEEITLPHSLRSSALLEKLQEQPSLVSLEGGLWTKKRTMYLVSTCAAAFVMVVGLVKFYPMMNLSDTMAAAPAASSTAYMTAEASAKADIVSNYQQIVNALQILSETQNAALTNEPAPTAEEAPANTDLKAPAAAATSAGKMEAAIVGGSEIDAVPEEETEEEAVIEEAVVEEAEEAIEEEILYAAAPAALYSDAASDNNLVSTTGEWVFWLEQDDATTLHLINTETMEEEASLSLPEASMVSELASFSNMLVCIDPYNFTDEEGVPGITVYLYQLGEDKTASLLNTIAVSGIFDQSYLSSDGILFLASNQILDMEAVAQNTTDDFSEILPKVFNDQYQDEAEPLPVENIAVIDTPVQPNYLNITAIDLANGGTACTWSFLGREGTLTISDHIMQMITPDGEGGSQLISIDFSGNTVQYRISNSIPTE